MLSRACSTSIDVMPVASNMLKLSGAFSAMRSPRYAVALRQTPGSAAYVALGFGVLCIGLSAIFVKLAGVPGPVSAFYRVFFAVVLLTPWWLLRRRPLPSRRVLLATCFGGLFFAADLVLWNSAIMLTDAGVATLLANNAPIWVGLAAWLFLHDFSCYPC